MAGSVDFGRTASDYGRYRAGFPERFYSRLAEFGVGRPGQRVLDIGTGTGTVARELARRGGVVTGLDRSASLMDEAKRLDAEAGVAVTYVTAKAEETGLPDASFDVVTAATCWHWFDRARAAGEVLRVLVPGGVLVIAHLDWIGSRDNVVAQTEQLIGAHNADWQNNNPGWRYGRGLGITPEWLRDVADAGFVEIETFSFDVSIAYGHERWRGRIRASAGVGASLSPDAVARFDADLARLLAERFPVEPLQVPHRVWAVVCRKPGVAQ